MTSLSIPDPGLVILPTHVWYGYSSVLMHNLKSSLAAFFEIREVELAAKKAGWKSIVSDRTDAGKNSRSSGVYGLEAGRICILTLKMKMTAADAGLPQRAL
jgi:hypothetical protein